MNSVTASFRRSQLLDKHQGCGTRARIAPMLAGDDDEVHAWTAVFDELTAADADPRIPRDRIARLALLRRGFIPWLAGIDPESGGPRRRVARMSEIPAEARPLIDQFVAQHRMSDPRRILVVGRPVACGALDAGKCRQCSEILVEPALQ